MIDFMERRAYKISWNIGKEILELTVPADCQLLLGANAIELEDNFERIILNTTPQILYRTRATLPAQFFQVLPSEMIYFTKRTIRRKDLSSMKKSGHKH